MKTAMITGLTGQDGSYLAEFLLEQGYKVIGLHRRTSTYSLSRVKHLLNNPNLVLEEFDITDRSSCESLIGKYKPDEFYNLAAQSHVGTSFTQPCTTFDINTNGVVNLLESIRNVSPNTKFYQASTSEMFGFNYDLDEQGNKYQNEQTQLLPQSPYGVAKLASHNLVRIYRSAYGIFGCCGILFNHESPRRGEFFVTRKITKWLGSFKNWCDHNHIDPQVLLDSNATDSVYLPNIKDAHFPKLRLGNIHAYRDWGHARDYVKAMWLMLQQNEPDDYVIATGETHSVEEFLKISFGRFGLDYQKYVIIDPQFYRPAEVDYLRGDHSKAMNKLGWKPETPFEELVIEMVHHDQMV